MKKNLKFLKSLRNALNCFTFKKNVQFSTKLFALLVCLVCSASIILAPIWIDSSPLSNNRAGSGAATGSDGILYVVGGGSYTSTLKTMEKYDPLLGGNWSAATSMTYARQGLSFVFGTDGFLYAIGGSSHSTQNQLFVERYNTTTNTWSTMASLPEPCITATVGPDNKIYAISGTKMFAYDPASNAWIPKPAPSLPSTPIRALTGLDGNIYLTSGDFWAKFNGSQWTNLPESSFGSDATTAPDGKFYVLGVNNNSSSFPTGVNIYNPNGTELPVQNYLHYRSGQMTLASAEGNIFNIGGHLPAPPFYTTSVETYGTLKSPDFAPNCKALWRFDAINGNSTPDSKGTNNGTVVGQPSLTTGRVVKSIQLNGTSQYLTANNAHSLNFGTTSMSIEGWVKWSPINGNSSVVTILDKRTTTGGKYKGYSLFITAAGKLGIQLANGVTYQNYVATQTTIHGNKWTHIAASIDRSSPDGIMTLFVNSVIDKTFTPLQGNISNTAPVSIGKHLFSNAYYKGELDEVALYNRALKWAEIRAIFLAGKEGKQ